MINIGYIILGAILLFFPGFLLSCLLYPGEGRLDFWTRFASSIGLSTLVDMLIILMLSHPEIQALRFWPVIGSILGFSAIFGVLIPFFGESLEAFLAFFGQAGSEE